VKRASIVYNHVARNAPAIDRLRAACTTVASEWEIDILVTDAPGHGTELARHAFKKGAQAVFACGGDGTINEVANGLAGTDCALGVLRGGMGNVFAKEIGVDRKPERALTDLLNGDRRRFDLGIAAQRRFLLMAGIGMDASVVRVVPDDWKRRLGSTSYAIWGARVILRYRAAKQTRLLIDGEPREADLYWMLIGNTRSYGGITQVTQDALVDDGRLDAYLLAGGGIGWLASTALKLALRRQRHGGKGISFYRFRELTIETPGLPIQADGEYFGETPMTFSVDPQALDVLLPKGHGSELFGAT
jgi:YegS/Rv2252/BmrU family lipid kinase